MNGGIQFPDEVSLFVGEAITPRLGTFLQFTYTAVDGSLAIDNAELRYANHTSLSGKPLTFGMTLNNNPSMQDVWNSTPVWGFPYVASPIAAVPAAAALIDGSLGQSVAGLGAYAFFDNAVYAETPSTPSSALMARRRRAAFNRRTRPRKTPSAAPPRTGGSP